MKTTINTSSSLILPPNPKTFLPQTFQNNNIINIPKTPFSYILKCSSKNGSINSSENSGEGGLKDVLLGMVDESVGQLLNKEENRDLLDGLEKASLRVEMAKRELAEIEKQEKEAKVMRDYINQLESRASEIAECQKEITDARLMVEEAERSLNISTKVITKDEERLESVKAASIAAVIGTLAQLPISLTRISSNSELILPLAITFISCALFGVTFRYAIRKDLDNSQLKLGTSAAFGFVKGLGTLGGGQPLDLVASSILSHAFDGAVYVSESVLVFLFAGVALEFCIKLGTLSTFPIDRSVPKL